MAICSNCQAKLIPGDEVCAACGDPVPKSEATGLPDRMLGRVIADNYEIAELLGEGAMGRVYRARQRSLDKQVAIKVLHRHLAADPKVGKRFHREARAASRLSHPNSLHIIDFGEDEDGTLYIAMELLDGDDLLTVIESDAPLSPSRILDLFEQVLAALDAAHHAGIIHRDLKPENVVVLETRTGDEVVKVCDFGIAKISEAEGGSAITVTGFVCGTPEYMAPEQARGEPLDLRADIYAAGCMLYQLMTAELPFSAESALGIITKHLTETVVPPSERRPEWHIPDALEHVCLKAMSKKREERYGSAIALRDALREAVTSLGDAADHPLGTIPREELPAAPGRQSQSRSEPTRLSVDAAPPARPWAVITLSVIGAGAIALATLMSGPGADPPEEVPTSGPNEAATPEDTEEGQPAPPSDIATDGGAMANDPAAPPAVETTVPDAGAREGDAGRQRRRPRARRPSGTRGDEPDVQEAEEQPEAPESPAPGPVAYAEGRRLFLANDIEGAIRQYETAARLMPRNPQVQKQLGRVYMRAGDVGRALTSYRRYLDLAPGAGDRAIIERIIERGGS